MLKSTKLQLEQSELRQSVNGLLAKESLEDAERSELDAKTVRLQAIEPELRAALTVEGIETTQGQPLDAEERERRALLDRSRVASYVRAAVENREVSAGPEVELAAALGAPAGQIPYELLEVRAATTVPSGAEHEAVRPIQPNVFSRKHAAWLGIDMPQIGSGHAVYPVITGSTPAAPKAAGSDAGESAATISVSTIKPRRITGSFRIRAEDVAVLPDLEQALRRDIGEAIASRVDIQQIAGNGSSPNVSGVLQALTDPTAPGSANTFATYLSRVVGELEGVHANELSDLRLLVGLKTFEHMTATTPTNDDSQTVLEKLRALGVQIRAAGTDWLAAPASNVQQAVVRLGMRSMVAVNPVWQGLSLIRDPYSSAPAGEVVLTAAAMIGNSVKLLHSAAFSQTSFKLA